jgi:lipopolysaccharide transport system ATP-binding protein
LDRAPQKSPNQQYLWALRDVSFELGEAQSLALIGPNGAGKTTVLKLLANITWPTSGRIETSGRLSALIELGAGFHPDLTGRENIYLNGTILGLKRHEIERRFDEIVAFSELERFLDTPLKRYSSGMAVRLGFSVAACVEPDILLVDEVLAVGDASFRQKCIRRIQDLIEGNTSLIFVSHNLWLVQAVCRSALYIERGQIRHRGPTSEVVDVYDQALHEQRARSFEASRAAETDLGADIEITRVQVLGPDRQENGEFRHDMPAEVQARYVAYRDIGEVNVVVRILRSDGLTCCMMRTKQDGFGVSVGRGAGIVSVHLDPLQLRGGTYYAQAIIRDANDADSMASSNSDWFSVQGSMQSFSEMNGVFEPRRGWNHREVSPKAVLGDVRDEGEALMLPPE